MNNACEKWDEMIWVDNGSAHAQWELMNCLTFPSETIQVRYPTNRGVARGYNTGMALATSDFIVITGCDMRMPDGWLATFKEYVEKIPETGMACMYSSAWPLKGERLRLPYGVQEKNGLRYVPAMPIERRIFRRSLLSEFGYFPESFGLYAFDDLALAARIEKVCAEKGLITYVIPDMVAQHLGDEGIEEHKGRDSSEYHAFKQREVRDPAKRAEIARLRDAGWPRFSPFL